MSALLPPSLTGIFERNQEATCYIGNLEQRVTDEIIWELFIQCGPVVNVNVPRDKITGEHQGFCFVEFRSEEDADYAIKILHMIKLFGKPIKVNKASQDKRTQEIGANIFVGNLSEEVDEKMLKDIFSQFGVVLSTKIVRDPESGQSKSHGFVSFDNFDSSDAAISKMNGQHIAGKQIKVTYALKKDSKGERHGSIAERVLAANRHNALGIPSSINMGISQSLTQIPSTNNLMFMNNNGVMPMPPTIPMTMPNSSMMPPIMPPQYPPQIPIPQGLPPQNIHQQLFNPNL